MKRIGKKVRDEAILICDIAASIGDDLEAPPYGAIASELGLGYRSEAAVLAASAWLFVSQQANRWTRAVDAEAAQLLREGWTP